MSGLVIPNTNTAGLAFVSLGDGTGAGYWTSNSGTSAITSLTGDVTATGPGASAATLAAIQGYTVSSTTPTSSLNLFMWNGSAWIPTAMSGDATMSDTGVLTVAKIQGNTVATGTPGTGAILQYNGGWQIANPSPNTNGQILTWNSSANAWEPTYAVTPSYGDLLTWGFGYWLPAPPPAPTGWTANTSGVSVTTAETILETLMVTGYNHYLVTMSGTMSFGTAGPFEVFIDFNGTLAGQVSGYQSLTTGAQGFSCSIIVGGSGTGSQTITGRATYILNGSGTAAVNLNAIGLA